MVLPSPLHDPHNARFAWARFRRLMWGMAALAIIVTIVSLSILHLRNPDASIHMFIASGLGIFFSVGLCSVLMGLVFLSAGTGHDEAIDDPVTRALEEDE